MAALSQEGDGVSGIDPVTATHEFRRCLPCDALGKTADWRKKPKRSDPCTEAADREERTTMHDCLRKSYRSDTTADEPKATSGTDEGRAGNECRCYKYNAGDRSRSVAAHLNDRVSEGLRSLLRQIVTDTAGYETMGVWTGKLF